jgi:hypothetical protein
MSRGTSGAVQRLLSDRGTYDQQPGRYRLLPFASTGVNKPTNAETICAGARSSGAMPRGGTKKRVLRGAATLSRTVAPKKQRIAREPNLSQELWKFL